MALMPIQERYFTAAVDWLTKADDEYDRHMAAAYDPKNAPIRDVYIRRAKNAHAKRGHNNWAATGGMKGLAMAAVAIHKGRQTKRPTLWLTTTSLVASMIQEILENGHDDPRINLLPLQIVVIQGTPKQKLASLKRLRERSGKTYMFAICNPEALLPPTGSKLAMATSTSNERRGEAVLPDYEYDLESDYEGEDAEIQEQVYHEAISMHWAAYAADEFHKYFRNAETRVYKLLGQRLRADWRLGASATPFPYKPMQFITGVELYQPGRWCTSKAAWIRDNFVVESGRVMRVREGWKDTSDRMHSELGFYYDLKEAAPDLPPIRFVHEKIELSKSQRDVYEQLRASFTIELDKMAGREGYGSISIKNVLPRLLRFKQICVDLRLLQDAVKTAREGDWLKGLNWERKIGETSPKMDRLLYLFLCEMMSHERAVVFTQWKKSVGFIVEDALKKGIAADYITGDVDASVQMHDGGIWSERLGRCREFNWGRTELMVVNQSATEGLNLQRGTRGIVMDLPESPDRLWQFVGRVRRPMSAKMRDEAFGGKAPQVTIHVLVAQNTIETKDLLPRLTASAQAAGMFTQGRDILEEVEGNLFTGADNIDLANYISRDELLAAL